MPPSPAHSAASAGHDSSKRQQRKVVFFSLPNKVLNCVLAYVFPPTTLQIHGISSLADRFIDPPLHHHQLATLSTCRRLQPLARKAFLQKLTVSLHHAHGLAYLTGFANFSMDDLSCIKMLNTDLLYLGRISKTIVDMFSGFGSLERLYVRMPESWLLAYFQFSYENFQGKHHAALVHLLSRPFGDLQGTRNAQLGIGLLSDLSEHFLVKFDIWLWLQGTQYSRKVRFLEQFSSLNHADTL